jgi:hypothetical protein
MSNKKSNKPAPLSVVEKFYIENNCKSLSLETISETLESNEDRVKEFYAECVDKQNSSFTVDKLMTINSKRGYAIMTKEASEKGEATKSAGRSPLSTHIHQIKNR